MVERAGGGPYKETERVRWFTRDVCIAAAEGLTSVLFYRF